MYLIKLFCDYFICNMGTYYGLQNGKRHAQHLFDKNAKRLPFSYYDKNNTGEMMTKKTGVRFI